MTKQDTYVQIHITVSATISKKKSLSDAYGGYTEQSYRRFEMLLEDIERLNFGHIVDADIKSTANQAFKVQEAKAK